MLVTVFCIRAPCPQLVSCQPKENPCNLKPDPGTCKAYIPSYFFNSTSGRCEKFIYGGCGGNDNRFSLLEDCREKCGEDPCNRIDCAPGSSCVVNEETGIGECVVDDICARVRCGFNTICQVNELTGEAECVPRTHPCAAILCGPGTICRVNPDTQTGYCGVDPCTFTRCGAGTVCQYNEEIDNSECVPSDEDS